MVNDSFVNYVGVHEDTDNIHIHFVMNTVSFVDGLKYSGGYDDLYNLTNYVNKIYKEYSRGYKR